jgi:hypothetical protein
MRDLRRDPLRAEVRHENLCSVVAASIAAVATVGSAVYASGAAKSAAGKQVDAANRATGVQQGMFDTIRSDLADYRGIGAYALPGLQRLLSGNPAEVQAGLEALPGYQFTRTQGLKAVQNSAAARGLGVSGASYKGAANFATGLADSTYGAQVNRLLDAVRVGESAAAQTGTFGTAAASSIGNNLIGAGNAAAGGIIGSANAISGGVNNLSQLLLLNKILGSGGAGGGGASTGMYGTPVALPATGGVGV